MEHLAPQEVEEILATDDDDRSKGNGPPFTFLIDPNASYIIKQFFNVEQGPSTIPVSQNQISSAMVNNTACKQKTMEKEYEREEPCSRVPPRTVTTTFTVGMSDINDNAPRLLRDSRPVIMEYSAPQEVEEILATDDDDSSKGNGPPFPNVPEIIKQSFNVQRDPSTILVSQNQVSLPQPVPMGRLPKPSMKAFSTVYGIFLEIELPKFFPCDYYAKIHHYEIFGYKEQTDLVVPDSLWRKVDSISKTLLPGLFLLRDIVNPGVFFLYLAALDVLGQKIVLSDTVTVNFQGLMPPMPRSLTSLEISMDNN
ncbi:neural-cadherin [Trichonephila inaurata madagascariensis]|uniref:Neural-cadherin n=1 Tax=Trichonephila inaurata madagascariensis TaxID=2747483 RepID=A0A8X6YBD9_9ARAC|nr:neural-cadherin [Trichonephila inaurata madagascariensis]